MDTCKLLRKVAVGLAASLMLWRATGAADDITAALAVLPDVTVLARAEGDMPTFLVGDLARVVNVPNDNLAAAEFALAAQLTAVFAPFRLTPADLRLRRIRLGPNGHHHYRYRQVVGGLEVIGGDLVVHVNAAGSVYAVNGNARGDLPREATRDIGGSAALLSIARNPQFAGLSIGSSPRLVYHIGSAGQRHRAYEVVVEGQRGADPVRDQIYVDAVSGKVIARHPQIKFVKSRSVYSANNGTSLPGTLRRSEGQLPSTDADINTAYDNTGAFYDAYAAFWGRDSYDNLGAQLSTSVHYSSNYCNAFWNGTQLVFGDGNPTSGCLPLVAAVDLTAHELAHAVTELESALVYSGESGGINESMSDVFGAFVEAWVDGGGTGVLAVSSETWQHAEDVSSPAWRFLNDPAADGYSPDFYSSAIGNLDVHYSSGVSNLAFYLLSQGGLHPRGKSTVQVPGIGMDKAIRIFYEANVSFLTPNSDYLALRNTSMEAARALGYDLATQSAVACAFAAVGVGTCGSVGVLSSGVPLAGLGDKGVGKFAYWAIEVPRGQSTLTVQLKGGSGNADLYVRAGAKPHANAYDCRSRLEGNVDTCVITAPAAGIYWIGLRTRAAYTDVSLLATYSSASLTRN